MDHGQPRSTVDQCPWKATELIGAQPVAALELKGACQGGKTGSGNPFRASPEGERWRGGWVRRSVVVVGVLGGARSGAGDEQRRASEGLVRCGVLLGSSGRLL
jgi:hypothetical protein